MKQFFQWAFLQNVWLWFHILAGGLAAKLGLLILPVQPVILIILTIAVIWEIGEFFYIMITENDAYESLTHFLSDAVGDILGTMAMVAIVII